MDERIGNVSWLLQRVVTLADTRPVIRSRQGAAYSLQDWRSAKLTPAAPTPMAMASKTRKTRSRWTRSNVL